MPKATFHNLSEEKKTLLITALRKEFSRAPLYEASISNIIKDANIPRGSFYQYFVDKEDAYFYLLGNLSIQTHEKFLSMLEKNKGSLFDTLPEFFQCIIQDDENFYFFKNTILNMNHKIEKSLSEVFTHDGDKKQFLFMSQFIKTDELPIQTDEELYHFMKIIAAITFHNFIETFSKNLSPENALHNYITQINILKRNVV
ncbi:TetR/AcrR family transcriptional regulator [Bacillaceae bacterium S4-13-56]